MAAPSRAYDHRDAAVASEDRTSMKYKKPQKGNPHQLVVQQHCFPRKSIARFVDANGTVHVHIVKAGRTVRLMPEDPIFCARRTWDERAESVVMKEIEDAYQDLADKIENGNVMRRLTRNERQIVTDMYALWNIRWHWKNRPLADQKVLGVLGPTRNLSLDEQERMEKHHIAPIRPDASIDGRHLTGLQIQRNIFQVREEMVDAHWGILKSRRVEFVVPDNSGNRVFIPITPQICLANTQGYRTVEETEVLRMNAESIRSSREYYFARNLQI